MQYLERDARCITLLPLTTEENEQFYVILYLKKKKTTHTMKCILNYTVVIL